MKFAADCDETDSCCDRQGGYQQLMTVIAYHFHIVLDDIAHRIIQRASGNERDDGRNQEKSCGAFAPARKDL